jgi:hypothetical protein
MGAFLGCCVIAAVLFYVGRKIARVLWSILRIQENHFDRLAYRDGMDLDSTPIIGSKPVGKEADSIRGLR